MPSVITVGLDGATWDLLAPWADQGELPSLKKLMQQGVWATLESTIPPLTGPAWASFATGRNPGKHGVFGFGRLERDSARLYTARDVRSSTIPGLLSRRNLASVVIGLPLSFPPSSQYCGTMISDFLYHAKAIVPASKRHYIGEYRVIPDLSLRGEELVNDIIDTAERQVQVGKELFVKESWQLFLFYFGMTDTILHFFWKEVWADTRIGQEAKRLFRVADDFLGWLLDHMGSDSILLLVSDHGFAPCPFQFNLNTLLLERGLLRTSVKAAGASEDQTLDQHLIELGGGAAKRSGARKAGTEAHVRRRKRVQRPTIDYADSTAFVIPGCVSLHIGAVDASTRARTAETLVQELGVLEHEGRRVFDHVLPREQVYSGPLVASSPDILLVPNGYFIASDLRQELFQVYEPAAFHDPRGIFLAFGSGIGNSSGPPGRFQIYDVAPTILHILGVPIPDDMDGHVLREVFLDGTDLARREPVFQPAAAWGEGQSISRKVRKLLGLRRG